MTFNPDSYDDHGSSSNTAPGSFDLSQFDDAFEDATVEPMENEEPPDGKYQVFVEKVSIGNAKTSGNPMLKWQFRIIGPRAQGRCLFKNNVLASAENVKWLKKDLDAAGMDVATLKLSDLPNRLEELLDRQLEIQKKTNGEYTNVYINRRISIDVPDSARGGSASSQGESPGGTGHQADDDDGLPF